ncbi:hypothetical protein EJ077_09360 [Mesorhizobium sp. M8A.F.Ca.ET.057.01.1.1]|nr:hypothetical protein EJ077_09360 [Mesorhizobium sp. M8A.F.Ca.ET.057.01.1.1]
MVTPSTASRTGDEGSAGKDGSRIAAGSGARPPLACRPSPPRGGRLDVVKAFANLKRCKRGAIEEAADLPLVGEMAAGQRGACPTDLTNPAYFVSFSRSALSKLSLPMTMGVKSTSFSFGSVLSLA